MMSKRLVLSVFVFAILFVLAINAVSAWGGYGYGGGYYGYNSGYRDYNDCGGYGFGGYGYGGYGYSPCYRTDTFRDTTENRHTTISTSRDRFTTESIRTVTTSYTDIQRETRTPIRMQISSPFFPFRTFYPSRTVIGNVDGYPSSYWRFKEPFDPNNPRHMDSRYSYYYQPRYDPNLGYYNWRY